MVTEPSLIKLVPFMERPKGTNWVGSQASQLKIFIGAPFGTSTDAILDSGSSITLISSNFYKSLKNPPKLKIGNKIQIHQVSGTLVTDKYIRTPIYIKTEKAVITMEFEAYLVPKMEPDFIIGNDTADQFLISLERTPEGNFAKFSDSGIKAPLFSSIYSTEQIPKAFVLAVETMKHPKNHPTEACLTKDYLIAPSSTKMVEISVAWKDPEEELYIEAYEVWGEDGILWHPIEAIISKGNEVITIVNPTTEPLELKKGQVIGKTRQPNQFLDDTQSEGNAHTKAIAAAFKEFSSRIPQKGKDDEIEGLPKTIGYLTEEPVLEADWLEHVNFGTQLPKEQLWKLRGLVSKYKKAFSLDGNVGNVDREVHLQLKEGAQPYSQLPYPTSQMRKDVISKQCKEWQAQGIIEPCESPWGAPVVLVSRNGKFRMAIDYRELNKRTVKDEYPLPRQDWIMAGLSGNSYFSTMDANAGFHQLKMGEDSQIMTAFRTHEGLYKFKRLPFGIHNGPPVYQRTMNDFFSALLGLGFWVYVDDLIAATKTFKEHLTLLSKILDIVVKVGLTLSPKKCFFGFHSIKLLGQKVSRLGMSTQEEKIDAINRIETPQNLEQLRTFLGLSVYYSQYVPYYSIIAGPLHKLTQKDVPFLWTTDHQIAFETMKQVLSSSPIMAYPIPGLGYRLYTDASGYGIGAVLQQRQPIRVGDLRGTKIYEKIQTAWREKKPIPNLIKEYSKGIEEPLPKLEWAEKLEDTVVWVERVIAYWSKTLKKVGEVNYTATELECFGAAMALVKFMPFIEDELILLITDHSALIWSRTYERLNALLKRMGIIYRSFLKLVIVHRGGVENKNADVLSRIKSKIPTFDAPIFDDIPIELEEAGSPPHRLWEGKEKAKTFGISDATYDANDDEQGPMYIKIKEPSNHKTFLAEVVEESPTPRIDPELNKKYLEGYWHDPFFQEIYDEWDKGKDPNYKKQKKHIYFVVDDMNLIWFTDPAGRTRLGVPKSMVSEVLKLHDQPIEGSHFGIHKTQQFITQSYYWKTMAKDIEEYVASCDICQKTKNRNHAPYGMLRPITIPRLPFQTTTMDFIMDLPPSGEHNAIWVAICKLSKFAIMVPCKTTITAKETAELFFKEIVLRWGMPQKVISDRDVRWSNEFWPALLELYGSKPALSTAYHPQTDGQTEVMNRIIEIALRAYINTDLTNWAQQLPSIASAYNNSINDSGSSPFQILSGYPMPTPGRIIIKDMPDRLSQAEEFAIYMENIRSNTMDSLALAQEVYTNAYNQGRLQREFEVGDLVIINAHGLRLKEYIIKGAKLTPRFEGPYEIIEKLSSATYKVRLPPGRDIHPVINISYLEPYKTRDGQKTLNPRISKEPKEEDWEVEKITAEKDEFVKGRSHPKKLYQAEWRDSDGKLFWSPEWVPAKNFNNAPEVVKAWKKELQQRVINKARKVSYLQSHLEEYSSEIEDGQELGDGELKHWDSCCPQEQSSKRLSCCPIKERVDERKKSMSNQTLSPPRRNLLPTPVKELLLLPNPQTPLNMPRSQTSRNNKRQAARSNFKKPGAAAYPNGSYGGPDTKSSFLNRFAALAIHNCVVTHLDMDADPSREFALQTMPPWQAGQYQLFEGTGRIAAKIQAEKRPALVRSNPEKPNFENTKPELFWDKLFDAHSRIRRDDTKREGDLVMDFLHHPGVFQNVSYWDYKVDEYGNQWEVHPDKVKFFHYFAMPTARKNYGTHEYRWLEFGMVISTLMLYLRYLLPNTRLAATSHHIPSHEDTPYASLPYRFAFKCPDTFEKMKTYFLKVIAARLALLRSVEMVELKTSTTFRVPSTCSTFPIPFRYDLRDLYIRGWYPITAWIIPNMFHDVRMCLSELVCTGSQRFGREFLEHATREEKIVFYYSFEKMWGAPPTWYVQFVDLIKEVEQRDREYIEESSISDSTRTLFGGRPSTYDTPISPPYSPEYRPTSTPPDDLPLLESVDRTAEVLQQATERLRAEIEFGEALDHILGRTSPPSPTISPSIGSPSNPFDDDAFVEIETGSFIDSSIKDDSITIAMRAIEGLES